MTLTIQERVWIALDDKPLSRRELVARCGLEDRQVDTALRNMRGMQLVAVTGFTHRTLWMRIPGAKLKGDGRGKRPASKGNLSSLAKRTKRLPPALTWGNILG